VIILYVQSYKKSSIFLSILLDFLVYKAV